MDGQRGVKKSPNGVVPIHFASSRRMLESRIAYGINTFRVRLFDNVQLCQSEMGLEERSPPSASVVLFKPYYEI